MSVDVHFTWRVLGWTQCQERIVSGYAHCTDATAAISHAKQPQTKYNQWRAQRVQKPTAESVRILRGGSVSGGSVASVQQNLRGSLQSCAVRSPDACILCIFLSCQRACE